MNMICWDGRVGLRRQIKVLVRKGVGSNPTLNNYHLLFYIWEMLKNIAQVLLFTSMVYNILSSKIENCVTYFIIVCQLS